MAGGPPNIECFKKKIEEIFLFFYFLNLFLKIFQSQRALSHSLGTKAIAGAPPNMKCFKKKFQKRKKNKIYLFYFF
jgi:hypothetical protein